MELAHAKAVYRFGETEIDFRKRNGCYGNFECDAGFIFRRR